MTNQELNVCKQIVVLIGRAQFNCSGADMVQNSNVIKAFGDIYQKYLKLNTAPAPVKEDGVTTETLANPEE